MNLESSANAAIANAMLKCVQTQDNQSAERSLDQLSFDIMSLEQKSE
jgi:hypothetical protein